MLVFTNTTFHYKLTYVYYIQQEIKTWLEGIVAELQNVESLKCQFISSVCIACCVQEYHVPFAKLSEYLYPLLEMLCVQTDAESKSCPNVSYLMDITDKSFR